MTNPVTGKQCGNRSGWLRVAWFFWAILLAAVCWGQQAPPSAQNQSPAGMAKPSATGQAPSAAGQGAAQEKSQAEAETRISPQQAEELFRSVDEILKFCSDDTGLPIKHEVKRRLTSREEVEAYLEKQMSEDKDARRLQRSELVLKKFGLIPRDFDLRSFLVALLKEQVAGYYDYKTKTVNLLDWVDAEQQKPVLAHELTHALQDQSFDLGKWMKAGDVDLDNIKQLTWSDIQKDEVSTARQAVVEGGAMVTLVDYMLLPLHQSLLSSPQIAEALKQGMLTGVGQSPEFDSAPIFLKESLTFPYRYGIDFIAELLRAGGKQKAFAGAFLNPPRTTREIMEPKTYLAGEQIPPMPLPNFNEVFKKYERFDVGAMGEFDVAVLLDQYAGMDASHALYPEWRGGYYYSVRPKGDPGAPLGLMYASRWSSPDSAAKFAAIYAKYLAKRYKQVREVADEGKGSVDLSTTDKLTGEHSWLTEGGTVLIDVAGDLVLVTESLDPEANAELEWQVLSSGATAK
jgi:hypothetical protein